MTLAIDGGRPVRTMPFPRRMLYGTAAEDLLLKAVRRQNLFSVEGELVSSFERKFAELYDCEYGIATSSGTAAVHAALAAFDIEPGSEVITAPITDAGSVVPILYQQAVPVFADVDPSLSIDVDDVERKITRRTSAILAVHLLGNGADVAKLRLLADTHGLALIEDCSQAHVTKFRGRYLGTYGDIGVFSLQQSKHLTTGEGGMVITDDPTLAERAALFRDKGWARQGYGSRSYVTLGLNYRMTEMQAAVGIPQLQTVRQAVERRMEIGDRLAQRVAKIPGLQTYPGTRGSENSYWKFAFQVRRWTPEAFSHALCAEGLAAASRYIGEPIYRCMAPLAESKTFGSSSMPLREDTTYPAGLCPRATHALEHLVTIPIHEGFADMDVNEVGDAVEKVARLLPSDID